MFMSNMGGIVSVPVPVPVPDWLFVHVSFTDTGLLYVQRKNTGR